MTRWSPGMLLVVTMLAVAFGCAHRAPTIAHVHIGHAITGAHDTPGRIGYLTLAEEQARAALAKAEAAVGDVPLADVQRNVSEVNDITNRFRPYPLTGAVEEAASHIEYAALSADASANVKAGYRRFAETIEGVLTRGSLIDSYARDIAATGSPDEAQTLAQEVHRLARANVFGEDVDGDGSVGSQPEEYGLVQIREDLDALVGRENPPYVTVDRWYLFNLIRLPSGEWIFPRSGSRGSRAYQ